MTRKREEISKLLIELMKKTSKGDKMISLPTVIFPTQDGKLKPKTESEKGEKLEKTTTSSTSQASSTTTTTTTAAATTSTTTTTSATTTPTKFEEGKRKIETDIKTSAINENIETTRESTNNISLIPYSSTSSSSCSSNEGNAPDLPTDIVTQVR